MTKFENGVAKGKILQLLRMPMPFFLRITEDKDGEIDALDMLDDEPKDSEKLYAYVKAKDDGTVHVDGRDKHGKRFGKWYSCCTYRLYGEQPDDATLRGKDSWPKWCMEQVAKIRAQKAFEDAES